MKTETYPLAVPEDLLKEIRRTSKETGLSMADAMRQSMKLGLPKLRQELAPRPTPMTAEEERLAFGPNPEFDELEHHCASLPKRLPEA